MDMFCEFKRAKMWWVKEVSKEIGKLVKNLKELESWIRIRKFINKLFIKFVNKLFLMMN